MSRLISLSKSAGIVFCFVCLIACTRLWAAQPGQLQQIASARPQAQIPVFFSATPNAVATLILLPGGAGGMGRIAAQGWPDGSNFLVRSAQLFAAQGFNIAVMARPNDLNDMDYPFRVSAAHIDDIRKVAQQAKERWNVPVWLVGTSRGTVSGTAAVIAMRDEGLIAGLVLTASITAGQVTGAVPGQALEKITVPVLVVHHTRDACKICLPSQVTSIEAKLTASPAHATLMVDGGENPSGDPCHALHYHGFIGIEAQAVQQITDWVKARKP
jgi:pimeloyl-ACP methyl ester carboxylesterase